MNKEFYKIRIPVLFLVVAMTVAVSCVNKDYKVDDVNTEVHLAPNGVSLPLATIDRETLADLFKNQDDLTVGDDGYYAFRYGDNISFNVDGINVDGLDGISSAFPDMQIDLGIPSFDFSGDTRIDGLNLTRQGTLLGLSGTVTGGQTLSNNTITSVDGEIGIDFGLPAEVKKINTVWLGPAAAGTLVTVTFDLGELQNVNGGTNIQSLVVELPERYVLKNPSAGSISPANKLTVTNYNVGTARTASITFYIESLTLDDKTPVANPGSGENEIKFSEPFSYSLTYQLVTKTGDVNGASTDLPKVTISGQPEFKDAIFTSNDIIVNESDVTPLDYRLNSIAGEVVSIASVDFAEGHKTIVITVGNMGLPFSSEPDVKVTFPAEFLFTDPKGNINGNVLTAPLADLEAGYQLQLNSIGLGSHGVPVNGTIDFSAFDDIEIEVNHTFASQQFRWSTDIEPLNPNSVINVDVDADGLQVSTVHAVLDLPLDDYIADAGIEPIDLSDLTEKMGDEEQYPDLKAPTISMTVSNSSGIEIIGDLTLDPTDKDGTSLGKVEVGDITIEPSGGQGAEISHIFIAEQGETVPAGYTPYYTDMDNLMKILPTTVNISLSAKATPNKIHSIRMNEDFLFEMSYGVDMPIEFGDEMNLVIEINEDGLNETFTDLADMKVKAADILAHAQLTVSFPLKVSGVTAEFLNEQGASINGLTTTVTGVIEGPQPDAGGAKTSTLTIAINVPNGGDFKTLSEIDQLKLRLPVSGTGAANRLKPDDYISGKVWLTLDSGVHVDLNEL